MQKSTDEDHEGFCSVTVQPKKDGTHKNDYSKQKKRTVSSCPIRFQRQRRYIVDAVVQ